MTPREISEQIERQTLCEYASFSDSSKGRARAEKPCDLRTCYQRDRDRIIHSKAFRRLKQKTQVFLSPEGDHYRTRLTHTLEVAQIARTIARALRLNEDLTEAIALGHDLGHTPYGHAGERALNSLTSLGFKHYLHSVRVAEKLEKNNVGLNLTWEVLNGIATHSRDNASATKEGCIVRYSDRIAYMNHDIEDAISAGVIKESDVPEKVHKVLGDIKTKRITTLTTDMVAHGAENIGFSPEVNEAYLILHSYMYNTVYVDKVAKKEEQKVEQVLGSLYKYFTNDPYQMPESYIEIMNSEGLERAVVDYIASMSDAFATRMFEDLFVPKKWQIL